MTVRSAEKGEQAIKEASQASGQPVSMFDFVIVVGDLDYYERFGFNRIEQDIKFYGPVDKNKLLLKTIKKDLLFKGEKFLDFS